MNDPSFPYRVAFGLTAFLVMGLVDLVRNPQNPKRLKEYGFLFGVTACVMLYGLAHDAITFSLSAEYFSAVKGLRAPSLYPDVALLALTASWTVGLAIGLAFLVANNPSKRWPQLPYRRLSRHLGWPIVLTPLFAICAATASVVAPEWSSHLLGVEVLGVRDTAAVTTVWAIHIGTYVGASFGLVGAVVWIVGERRGLDPRRVSLSS